MINEIAIAVQASVPVIIWGDPGTGKTATVTAIAKALNRHLEIVIASIREPSDFSGLPVITHDGVRLVSPAWAMRLAAAEWGIVCFDELSCAPPANQAATLRIVNERWVGETFIGFKTAVIAISNLPGTAAGGWDLPAAQANRFCHLEWVFDTEAREKWIQGLLGGFPEPSVPRLPQGWEDGIGAYEALVAAFLQKYRPSLAMKVPDSEAMKGRAWPSPRTWTMGARLGAAAMAIGDEIAEDALVSGCVGAGQVEEFLTWRVELDLPDPETLLDDPSKYKHPVRGDLAYAILGSVVAAYMRNPLPERWVAAWKVLGRATKAGGADIAATHAITLAKNRHKNDIEAVKKDIKALNPLLTMAGYLKE